MCPLALQGLIVRPPMENPVPNQKKSFIRGCLIAIAAGFILITTAGTFFSIVWTRYWYEEDNAKRRDPMENLARFHSELKTYLSRHEGRYPAKPGVHGLAELTVILSDLRVKDDRYVGTDPDYLSEQITSYAYVAAGLSKKELDEDMPVIFEKPWNGDRIRVLLSGGRVEIIEGRKFKTCSGIVTCFKERSKKTSSAWKTLIRNAESIDRMQ